MTEASPAALSIEAVTIPKGKVVFRQGDKGDAAYLIESGSVGIFREVDGKRVPIATIGHGDLFGEMAVIDGSPRAATAYALEDTKVKVISVKAMIDTMRSADPFIRSLIHMLMNNLRTVHDTYTPKTRTLSDSIIALQRHSDTLNRLADGNLDPELKSALAAKMKDFDGALAEIKTIAAAQKGIDRRANAVPNEAEIQPA